MPLKTLVFAIMTTIAVYMALEAPAKAVDSACEESASIVSLAGDSITNVYWPTFVELAPPRWDPSKVAAGGLRAPQFNGEEAREGVVQDFTATLIELEPAAVILMLGTNDSLVDWADPDPSLAFSRYVDSMESILDRLQASGITVILGLPTPMLPLSENLAVGEARLASLYRPWLEGEADQRGLAVVDFFELFVSRPDWQAYFPDGVHPSAVGGAAVMGAEAKSVLCTVLVPEPDRIELVLAALFITAFAIVREHRSAGARQSSSSSMNFNNPS